MPSNPPKIELEWGYIQFDNNEISLVSTVEDPPKIRCASAAGISLGALSFGRLRPDGVHEEMVLVQGKQDERTRANPHDYSGEVTMHIRDGSIPGDAGMIKVLEVRHDSVWIKGLTTVSTPGPSPAPNPTPTPPPQPANPRTAYFLGPDGKLDFARIKAVYGFESDDYQAYIDGDMTADEVIAAMDHRAVPVDPTA